VWTLKELFETAKESERLSALLRVHRTVIIYLTMLQDRGPEDSN
jgi:hypothetical protein